LKVFVVIDQSAEAQRVGLHLPQTTLVVFGNPIAGTRVMQTAPLVAIDLPLKVLVRMPAVETRRIRLPTAKASSSKCHTRLAACRIGCRQHRMLRLGALLPVGSGEGTVLVRHGGSSDADHPTRPHPDQTRTLPVCARVHADHV
jgi:hypothetical protein